MKIFTAAQTRAADQATIQSEGISSEALMERAATAFTDWLTARLSPKEAGEILILCGPGNNGGDGLVVARRLYGRDYTVRVAVLPSENKSGDFQRNFQKLPPEVIVTELSATNLLPIPAGALVIDALFGTGLTRPLEGLAAAVVQHLNAAQARVVAVDIPSGLFSDAPQPADSIVVRARHTVSFELPKLAFMLPHNAEYVGQWHVLPIDLDKKFIEETATKLHFLDAALLAGRLQKRARFAHKGTYGHALLLAGSKGKIGAAVLAAQACLRSGVGLLTLRVPAVGYDVVQTAVPEAMCLTDPAADFVSELPDLTPYSSIGIGPGLGKEKAPQQVLAQLLREAKVPLVLDADALNILAENRELLATLPPDSLLTPHPKEFERLAGPARDDYHRLDLLRDFCQKHRCYTILKGANTCLGTPDGTLYFNSTGNPGMATGGSGDVLTGILTALRAQPLSPLDAALIGIYAHGRAGDLAAQVTGEAGLVAGDIARFIGPALEELTTKESF
ncbi:bifunctional NAD(P)H-hydrate repair enzyme [Hymenobacter qilianensis]|uniref:Bifunctional NAD(P)H-hydrate repair enzyme n=2 Tax=Hymenobacter qilianensis TaxID=1385715 RepID=A0ACB5PPU8_9BACT|nr:NAD(P)H-hydrate dehydratase [Hymenobacter qilianensis]QNP53081.1 NAD(P)H-hydrate dehydratase [Hymenobacter qilianensis]GGF60008.1 bifunctional NAD(P)H-hydrate repair enzyme [Hymenobacter qilianensis]